MTLKNDTLTYEVEWIDMDDKMHLDYFMTMTEARKRYPGHGDLPSNVQTWINTRQGVLSFLQELPLVDVRIREWTE